MNISSYFLWNLIEDTVLAILKYDTKIIDPSLYLIEHDEWIFVKVLKESPLRVYVYTRILSMPRPIYRFTRFPSK